MVDARAAEISRVLPAPVEDVFRWWTDEDLLARWMSPVGSAEVSVDLRVGGALRVVMRGAGIEIHHWGEYVEIDPPRRLVFTWNSPFTGGASLVTVRLVPEGDAARRISIVHSNLPEAVAESHAGGWGAMTDRLAGELAAT